METLPAMPEGYGQDRFFDETKLAGAMEQFLGHVGGRLQPHSVSELVQWLDDRKAENHIYQKRVGLNSLADWKLDGRGHLVQKEGRFFKIVGIQVQSSSREVRSWSQPMLDNVGTGIIGLLCRRVNGSTFFLMQAKAEAGNRNVVQIAPTVQFTQENYAGNDALAKPFLFDEFNKPRNLALLRESRQSEEGARFYKEQHIHRILLLPDGVSLDLPPEYRWFSYGQLSFFLNLGEYVNSCARSILSCLL